MAKTSLDILFNTDDLIAIMKPSGLATIPGRGETTSALEQVAKLAELPWSGTTDPRIRVVHRLDKDTSGVLLFAKHVAAQRHLSHQFQNNTIAKEYLALVAGRPVEDAGEIQARLAPHSKSAKYMAVSKQGRPAITYWKVEARFRLYSLLRVFPKTGKTHQIRVHLKHIGFPLAVDALYNPKAPPVLLSMIKRNYHAPKGEEEKPLIARLTLHAEKLRFLDLADKEVEITAGLPKDFPGRCGAVVEKKLISV